MMLPMLMLAAIVAQVDDSPVLPPAPPNSLILSIPGFAPTAERWDEKEVQKAKGRAYIYGNDAAEFHFNLEAMKFYSPEMLQKLEKHAERAANSFKWMQDPKFGHSFAQAMRVEFGGPEPRLNVEITDLPFREAIEKVIKATKFEVDFDDDLPKGARVTLKAPNIRLSTALNTITEAAGVHWSKELRITADSPGPKVIFRVQREPTGSGMYFVGSNGGFTGSMVGIGPGNGLIGTGSSAKALGTVLLPETRSSFTCPSCRGRVTVYRPKTVLNCVTCHTPYPEGARVCAKDGTRRPTPQKPWKYCPLCGKSVKLED